MAKLTPTEIKNAISGKNTLVGFCESYTSGGENTWTTLPGVTTTPAAGGTREDIDQTCIAEDTKRYIAGVFEGNEITLTFHHYTADETQKKFRKLAEAQKIVGIMYEFSDGTTCEFEVSLKTVQMQDPDLSSTLKWDVTMKVNSLPVWTEAEAE